MTSSARVWIPEAQRMIYPAEAIENAIFLGLDGNVYQVVKGGLYQIKGAIPLFDTGITDIVGQPVYQEDIVTCDVETNIAGIANAVRAKGVMRWNKHNNSWYIHMEKSIMQRNAFQVDNPRVVGNTYQNPELSVAK